MQFILFFFIMGPIVYLWHFIADGVKKTKLKKFANSFAGCLVGLLVTSIMMLLFTRGRISQREIESIKSLCVFFMFVFAFIGMIGDGFGTIVFWLIFGPLFVALVYSAGPVLLCIACILGAVFSLAFIFGKIVEGIGREVGEITSGVLQEVGVSKSTSDAIGGVAGGFAAGAIVKGAVDTVQNTYSDAVNSTSYANNSANYVPDGNPDLVHVDGYYRHDGTYVHSHVRTSPNDNIGDNISAHK